MLVRCPPRAGRAHRDGRLCADRRSARAPAEPAAVGGGDAGRLRRRRPRRPGLQRCGPLSRARALRRPGARSAPAAARAHRHGRRLPQLARRRAQIRQRDDRQPALPHAQRAHAGRRAPARRGPFPLFNPRPALRAPCSTPRRARAPHRRALCHGEPPGDHARPEGRAGVPGLQLHRRLRRVLPPRRRRQRLPGAAHAVRQHERRGAPPAAARPGRTARGPGPLSAARLPYPYHNHKPTPAAMAARRTARRCRRANGSRWRRASRPTAPTSHTRARAAAPCQRAP